MAISPEWLTTIATIALAITAVFTIFRDEIRRYFRHPRFVVHFKPGLPDCQQVPLDLNAKTPEGIVRVHSAKTHWVRARIKNAGEAGAEDIEVSVVEVRRQSADGNFRPMPMGTPWNLIFAHIHSHVLPRLPVGSERVTSTSAT